MDFYDETGQALQRMVVASVVLPSMKNTISYITVFEGSNVEGENDDKEKDAFKIRLFWLDTTFRWGVIILDQSQLV